MLGTLLLGVYIFFLISETFHREVYFKLVLVSAHLKYDSTWFAWNFINDKWEAGGDVQWRRL